MHLWIYSKLIGLMMIMTAFVSISEAHRPFPEVGCLNSLETNCLLEVKKPTFRKYELNFLGPTSEYGYECGILENKLYQQITFAEVLLQVLPGTIQLKKISSLTKMIDPIPQVNCVFSAESLSNTVRMISDKKTILRRGRSESDLLQECRDQLQIYNETEGFFANTVYYRSESFESGTTSCDVVHTRLEKK